MKGRLGTRVWVLVVMNAVALIAVLVLAYEAGALSGGLGLRDAGALGRSAGLALMGAMSVALVITLILILRLGSKVLKPVEELVAFSDRLTAGDYEGTLNTDAQDDFSLIAATLNEAASKLAGMKQAQQSQEDLRRSLAEICSVLNRAAQGEVSAHADTSHDDLSELVILINSVLGRFSDALDRVGNAASALSGSAGQILVSSEEMGVGANQQSQDLGKAIAGSQQIAGSLRQISTRLDAGVDSAQRALEAAEHGSHLLAETADGIQHIRASVQESGARLKALGDRSLEIYEIINVVNETNLMALNAAMEASRASDPAHGLEILAAELKKLSEHSRSVTRDIVALLKTLQSESNHALVAMEQGNREAELGARLTEQAGKALALISSMLHQSTELAEAVAAVANQQLQAIDTLGGSLQKAGSVARQAAQSARQIASGVEELGKISGALNQILGPQRMPVSSASAAGVGSTMFRAS